jgi:hypothetical protein
VNFTTIKNVICIKSHLFINDLTCRLNSLIIDYKKIAKVKGTTNKTNEANVKPGPKI